MDPVRNPYTPNAGALPEAIVGRDALLASFDVLMLRLSRGRTEQSQIITGLRGVGKTVLLGEFRRKALAADWVVVEIEVSKHDDEQFRRELGAKLRAAIFELSPRARWNDRLKRAAAAVASFSITMEPDGAVRAGLDVEALEGLADHQDLELDLADVLLSVGEAAESVGHGVVLLIDEVQFLSRTQLEALIGALHRLVQRQLPVTLVGAGLPQVAELAGDAKSYAERLFTFPRIGNLEAADASLAFRRPAESEGSGFDDDAIERAVEVTEGYPYFIQELGYAAWNLATGAAICRQDVERAIEVYEAKLDSSFFRVRLDRTTELQRAYLRAMASLGPDPQSAQDVAVLLGRTSPEAAPLRAELIGMGLLYTPQHGYAAFTVPHFDSFLMRTIPELHVPAPKRRGRRSDHS